MLKPYDQRVIAAKAEHLAYTTRLLGAYKTVTAEMLDPADEPSRQAIAAQIQQLIYEHRRDTAAKHSITFATLRITNLRTP